MRRSLALFARNVAPSRPNLIQIRDGTFYREHPSTDDVDSSSTNPPLFRNLSFELPATLVQDAGSPGRKDQHWAVIAANDGATFLEILRGTHLCFPPSARTFPYLASEDIERKDHRLRTPSRAIQYVGFNNKGQGSSGGLRGAYLSARYESRREETDWSVLQYLKGETELNPSQKVEIQRDDDALLDQVIADLRLQKLVSMPVSNLSNGQTRRARIAKALLGKPELLLLDEPFMGLDPPTLVTLSPILRELAYRSSPLLLLALRPQDPIPDWITHLAILGQHHTVPLMGPKAQVLFSLHRWADVVDEQRSSAQRTRPDRVLADLMSETYGSPLTGIGDTLSANGISKYNTYEKARTSVGKYFDSNGLVKPSTLSEDDKNLWEAASKVPARHQTLQDLLVLTSALPVDFQSEWAIEAGQNQTSRSSGALNGHSSGIKHVQRTLGEPLIDLNSVVVKYGNKTVLGFPPPQTGYAEPGLNLTIRQGTRLALLGPNGSGKTTLLSLLTSDHPHSYSLPIKFFGQSRLPSKGRPGLSLWDIQSRVGHSAPEIHAFFPKRLSIRRSLESAWSETYSAKPKLSYERDELVDAFLRWWEPELRQESPFVPDRAGIKTYRDSETNSIRAMTEQSYPPFFPLGSRWGDDDVDVLTYKSEYDLSWAEDTHLHAFGVLPFGTQRLLLLLRSLIKKPDIIILDEAFSGLSAEVREKAMCWLEHGETMFLQRRLVTNGSNSSESASRWDMIAVPNRREDVLLIAEELKVDLKQLVRGRRRKGSYQEVRELNEEELLDISKNARAQADNFWQSCPGFVFEGLSDKQAMVVVSHVKEEIPPIVDQWLRLPGEEEVLESGRGVEMGRCDDGIIRTVEGWNQVWGF